MLGAVLAGDVIERALKRRPAVVRLRAAVEMPAAAPLVVGGLMLAAFVARILLDRHVLAPWEMPDELLYADSSRSFLSHGHYLFRESPSGVRSVYPALISPAWLATSTQTAYTLIKVINSVLMTAGAIPLYLWARRLVAPLWGVLAVILYLAIPGFVYTAEILTENAFVPASILALFAIAVAIERPSLMSQLLALGAIALAAATRLQGLVFLVVLPTAIGLALLFDAVATIPGDRRRVLRERLRRFWPSLAVLVAGAAMYSTYELARGRPLSSSLGSYSTVTNAHYAFGSAARWVVYHFAELTLSVAAVPLSALIVLFGLACRRATAPGGTERAFLAVATAAFVWIVIQAGTFASHFSLRIEERYMFNVAPVLLLAGVVWLARGLPRPPALTAAAVIVPTALVLALPFETFFTEALFNDTFGLIPLWRLTQRFGGNVGDTRIAVAALAALAGLLFAVLPRRSAIAVIPFSVLLVFALSTNSVFGTVEFQSAAKRYAGGLQGDPSWIDHAIGRDRRVELVNTSDILDQNSLWQAEFWNRSVRRVFEVTAHDPSIDDVAAPLDIRGRIVPALPAGSPDRHPRYVAAARTVELDGTRIAASGELALWRVHSPLRLRSLLAGVTPDGWTGATATYTRYVMPRGPRSVVMILSRLGVSGLPPARVQITVGPAPSGSPWEHRAVEIRDDGREALLRLPVRRAPFQVRLTVSTTFSPTQFGSPDTRTLGVRASFSVR
ncbi:MAG: hypothetical protein WBB76_09805 [Gaiellaceae bacterium]